LELNDAEVVGGVGAVSLESAEPHMGAPSIRVLVIEDYKPWLRFISSELQKLSNLQSVGEVSDGQEAVRQAQELKPDLILLDIGLPTINGIEAARRIREVSPASKILFVSENRSPEIVEEALNTGAGGYVLKSDAASELLPAIKAVLQGKRFISASLEGHFLVAIIAATTQATLLTSMVTFISGIC
jgi:DNA-binding NarL/FixJ family response regulator